MTRLIFVLMFLFLILGTSGILAQSNTDSITMKAMSYNLRYDTEADGENRWDNRKDRVASLVRFYAPDFLGIQEGLVHQLEYLDRKLNGYQRIGVGREDGEEGGEFSAIYYNRDHFELVDGTEKTIWLSETPDEPSKSWDAALPRVLTFGKFKNRSSGKELYVFNTHFDHIGQQAREESSKLIVSTVAETAGDLPAILMGDFNVTEENPVYEVLTTSDPVLKDAFYATDLPHVGPHFTFEGFGVGTGNRPRRIDYIFTSDHVTVQKHAIISTFKNGFYPSDHLPVFAVIEIE